MSENDLFPVPSQSPSRVSPANLPGITPDSTSTLQRILLENHQKWHCFFNERGFHNHCSHHLLATWSLGADSAILEAAYKRGSAYQRPAFKSPQSISAQNLHDHLGDPNYYDAYLQFFKEAVREKGTKAVLEEYVFSPQANFVQDKGDKQPEMLSRFVGGLLHPFIHAGYGTEFGLPGMVMEGLSQMAVHEANTSAIITPNLFTKSTTDRGSGHNTHAFSIVARILKDSRFNGKKPSDQFMMFRDTMNQHGEALAQYVSEWTLDMSDPGEVERKVEEIAWTNAIIYGLAVGQKMDRLTRISSSNMHLVTSSLFLPSLLAYLSPTSQEILLRAYFVTSLSWWVARGRPAFSIPAFFNNTTAHPPPSGPLPTPHPDSLLSSPPAQAITPNPWLPIIETSITHPDDHLPKLQRALAHYSRVYGTRSSGLSDFRETELAGAEVLDGSLFIRVAGLTAERMGRVREGKKPIEWDRKGFYSA
ncbi:hypothetical protein BD779DRAFT_1675363 [Infundibulicybe gibba]|nr:hypothetical protein BD779DRAFT_1675363 [Infundibulicybe gibba]